jgi:Lon protease-like protein
LIVCAPAGARSAAQDQPHTLPPVIPIFPLEEAMLFPNASRPLHIFEPRYRAMINDVLKGDRIIGMVTLRPGYEANYEGRPAIYAVGCAGVISDVEELSDGRFNIVLRGFVKFRVNSEDDSRPYRLAHATAIPEPLDDKDKDALHKERLRLQELVTGPGGVSSISPDISDEEVVNALAQYVPLDPIQRQALLELDGVLSRSRALIDLLLRAGRLR